MISPVPVCPSFYPRANAQVSTGGPRIQVAGGTLLIGAL
jgi:hypothetical protein